MHARTRSGFDIVRLALFAALALLAGCPGALAASLTVGALELHYGPGWLRADAGEEARAESVILRQADASALTVMLPRHSVRLRLPEARFYRQLETVWRAQYGEAVQVDWLEAGGRRWRMLRRASLDRPEAVVFHLVTVIDGQAHHLLVQAPAAATELPEAVIQLLCAPNVVRDAAMTPTPAQQPLAAAPRSGWHLDRVLRLQPGRADLDRVMTQAQRALGNKGGITGLELEVRQQGLRATIEGFVWVPGPDRQEIRRPFLHRWDLNWTAPPEHWHGDEAALISVKSEAASEQVRLSIALRLLCGPADQLHALLGAVQSASANARERLERRFADCRAVTTGLTQAEITLGAGETSRPISIQLPDGYALPAGQDGLLVLSLLPSAADGNPGQALLETASIHYVYAWRN